LCYHDLESNQGHDMHILYRLAFSSGKAYVGQTVRSVKIRMNQHRQSVASGSQLPVHCAWRKHGEPVITVLAEFETHDELHAAEIAAIAELGTMSPNGYNVSIGGDTAPSKNPKVAAKIAVKAKGRKIKDTTRVADATRRKWQDDGYRQKVSDGLKAFWTDERKEQRSKQSKDAWCKRKESGYVMSDETKQKLASYERTAETRAKMSASAKRRPAPKLNAEAQVRQAAGVARSWADPEIRAKRLASMAAARERRKQEIQLCR